MKNHYGSSRSILRLAAVLMAAPALSLFSITQARADVFGRLQITVRSADTGQPVQGARVTFHDPTGVRGDFAAVTDAQGVALSPPLENHAWQVTEQRVTFEADTRTVQVAADTTSDVDVRLAKHIIRGSRTVVIRGNNTTDETRRDANFIRKYPANAGNPQSLSRILTTNPGFVQSSVNVVHPRGEHASTSIYLNGFLLPGVLQGRAGQQINPNIIQSADVQTGAYAPEYGSELAAVLNLSLRSGPITPFQTFSFDGGNYKTLDQEVTLGGQAGTPLFGGDSGGNVARRFRYLVNVSNRSTDNALESPQPDNQTAHNHGLSTIALGNFDYLAGPSDQFTLTINSAPAHTQIANRTGLGSKYAPVGQDYGYGGARNSDGVEPGGDPTAVGGQTIALGSQQTAGQDIYQNDDNTFGLLNYRHGFSHGLTGLLSLGLNHSGLDIKNHNPSIDPNSLNADGTLSVIDNSIEFNPSIQRVNTQKEIAGSLTQASGAHTYKAGFIFDGQTGDEQYQFVPQSQLALDALNAVQSGGGPTLTPGGAGQVDSAGNPVLDTLGNQVYLIDPNNSATPIVHVHRSGYYNAGYVQDTWRATRQLTINYGARLDGYGQKQDLGTPSVNQAYLSPRLNLAYAFSSGTTLLASYNKLFTQPPLAQGAIVGTSLRPQLTNAYEASVVQRLNPQQTAKISYYQKNDSNENDTGILIPYTQIGAYTTLQYQYATIQGLELSYDLAPKGNIGLGGYAAFTRSKARPGGLDQTGGPAPIVNDHDQRSTLSTGVSYTFKSQAFAGVDYYYGSGEASSVLAPIGPSNLNILNDGKRNSHSLFNLRLASPPIAGYGGLELDVDNLFDRRDVLNFNSGFSGTRFQQGRRVLLRATASF